MPNESITDLIHRITEGEPPPDSPDPISQLEEDYTAGQQEAARLKQLEQNIDERKKYANRIFYLVCSWLVFVGVLVLLNGVQGCVASIPFRLSDAVLIALITTTTINVIGVFLFVVRYLFPKDN